MAYTTIKKPSDYFNTVLYSGTGSNQSLTGVGFQPDLIWGKGRTLVGYDHRLADIVRGNTKLLKSNSADGEETQTTEIQSFDSDGFTVGTGGRFNNASQNYVAWNWLADNTSGSSNTDGSITSTVSANTTSGFSIVSYTGNATAGATVGHGLGSDLGMIFIKNRSSATNWVVYHKTIPATQHLRLNDTNAEITGSGTFNDTEPTSSLFSLGNGSATNENTSDYIAYCFAEKKAFSKFGSYTGNGNADGTFVYTGFKPAFVMVKRTDAVEGWGMFDDKRDTYNPVMKRVEANASDAERTDLIWYDFYSNGFKPRQSYDLVNASGGSYIYMAFAEEPLVGDNPCTAR